MDILQKYGYAPDGEAIAAKLQSLADNLSGAESKETLLRCFSMMDLTTLHTNDTVDSVKALVEKANGIKSEFAGYPLPASVCVFPNFASVVRDSRCSEELRVTAVAGCFPSSQSYLEVKLLECRLAVKNGADEIDIVLALNHFMAGDYEGASREISEIRAAIDDEASKLGRTVVLKVILETGLLVSAERIAKASFLAMEAGADFIKTSTGKVEVNATPMAAYVMCECIAAYYKATGRKVGFKAAGGISTSRDALSYYCIAAFVLGDEWLDKSLLRLGVSRLGNSLISAIEQKTVKYF